MRIAVMIIGLCLVMLIGLQSFGVMVEADLTGDEPSEMAGVTGMVIALLFMLGSAFAIGKPGVSMGIFIAAAVIGVAGEVNQNFIDWALVSLALASLAYFGILEKLSKDGGYRS